MKQFLKRVIRYHRGVGLVFFLTALAIVPGGWAQVDPLDSELPSSNLPGVETKVEPITAVVYVGVDPERPYRRGETWVPLTVELTNNMEAVKGFLVVRMKDGTVEYSVPINLPTKAKKSYDLTVYFPQMLDELNFYIRSGRKETQIEMVSVPTTYAETDRFMAVISAERGSHDRYNHRPEDEETELYRRVLYTSPDFLPRYPIGYQNLDVLVWDGGATTALVPEQDRALESWIQMGGTLILAAGDRWQDLSDSPFRLYIPLTLTGSRVLEAGTVLDNPLESERPALESGVVMATGQLLDDPNIQVLLKAGADPFLVERKWGAGRIVFVASSINNVLFDNPIYQTIFKNYLSKSHLPLSARVVGDIDSNIYGFLLSMIQAELPGTWFIAIYLGVYILLVVPVNYVVFRLIGRLEWAWFTVPIWAVIFAYGAYYIGALRQQGQVSVNQISVVEARASANTAQATTYSSIYSPVRNQYRIVFRDPVAFPLPMTSSTNRRDRSIMDNQLYVQYTNEGSEVDDFNIYHWSQETLKSQHESKIGDGVDVTLDWSNDRISGTIANHTGRKLYDPTIYIPNYKPNKRFNLPDLDEGATVEVDQSLNESRTFNLNSNPNINNMGGRFQEKRDAAFFIQNELKEAYANQFATQFPTLGMALLAARVEQPPLSFQINQKNINRDEESLRGESLLCVMFPLKERIQGRLLIQNQFWSFGSPTYTPGSGSRVMPAMGLQVGGGFYGNMRGNFNQRMTQFQAPRDAVAMWDFDCDMALSGGRTESLSVSVDYSQLGYVASRSSGQAVQWDLVNGKPSDREYEVQLQDCYDRSFRPLSEISDEFGNLQNPGRYLDKVNNTISARLKAPRDKDIMINMEAFSIRLQVNFGTEAGGKFLGYFVDAVAEDRSSAQSKSKE